MRAGARWHHGRERERGFAAVELAAGVAFLVVPVAVLVASLPVWFDRQSTARLAAREAARTVTLSGWCDAGAAAEAVTRAAQDAGLGREAVTSSLDCVDGTPLRRDAPVTAKVRVTMPALVVPLVGSVGGFEWTAAHVERADPYGGRP